MLALLCRSAENAARLLLAGVLAAAVLLAARSSPADEAIFARIEKLRKESARMRLDGNAPDWREFFQATSPQGDASGDASRDLVAAAIAPTETDLWVMLRTAATPSLERFSYYVFLSLYGDHGYNVKVELVARDEPLVAYCIDGGQTGPRVVMPRARAAVRRVVEMRIPWSELAAVVPKEHAERLSGAQALPWVRIECQTWDGRARRVIDHGPHVASFRLLPAPMALDEPLPERPESPVVIGLPTRGAWLVVQGPHGLFSHRDTWACDLMKVDAKGYFSNPPMSKKADDFISYNQPVYAPVAGTVLRARGDVDDSPVRGALDARSPVNRVYIKFSPQHAVDLLHLKRDSVTVDAGAAVELGEAVGAVGNSGASDTPHLHLAVWRLRPNRTAPLALGDVRVGLNPVPDDPWARRLPQWEPRKGYFVEPQDGERRAAP